MSYIQTIDPHRADASVRTMYERQRNHFGYLPNYARAFGHRPELMSLWADLLRGIKSKLDHRLFELVTFAAAHELGSSYCSLAHGSQLLSYFSEEEVASLARGNYVGIVTRQERAAMHYARLVVANASKVDRADIQRLLDAGYTDDEVFDIAATASARAFFAKLVDAVGTQPDSAYRELNEELRETLIVGRQIAI